jgi:hypothetical protein
MPSLSTPQGTVGSLAHESPTRVVMAMELRRSPEHHEVPQDQQAPRPVPSEPRIEPLRRLVVPYSYQEYWRDKLDGGDEIGAITPDDASDIEDGLGHAERDEVVSELSEVDGASPQEAPTAVDAEAPEVDGGAESLVVDGGERHDAVNTPLGERSDHKDGAEVSVAQHRESASPEGQEPQEAAQPTGAVGVAETIEHPHAPDHLESGENLYEEASDETAEVDRTAGTTPEDRSGSDAGHKVETGSVRQAVPVIAEAHAESPKTDQVKDNPTPEADRRSEADKPSETDQTSETDQPSEAAKSAESVERPQIPDRAKHVEAPDGRLPGVVDPALRETADSASTALEAATEWQRRIECRLQGAGRLIGRVLRLEVVRSRPDLIDELNDLDLTDPNSCLHTVAIVLAEALGLQSVVVRPGDVDGWLHALGALADQAEQLPHEVKVVPGADGKIDGRMPEATLSSVEVQESVGVMWGAHNRLHVTHLCVVEHPVIEIADLVEMGIDGPVFDWSAWAFTPAGDSGSVSVGSSQLSDGYWTNIWNCRGVTIGNRNTLDVTYVYKMASCHVNLAPLLRDAQVRADLVACLDDSPENAARAEAARRRLPQTVAHAADATDLSSLVSDDEIAAHAATIRRPHVRGRRGGILVSHGVGVAVGFDPRVSSTTNTRIGAFRIM